MGRALGRFGLIPSTLGVEGPDDLYLAIFSGYCCARLPSLARGEDTEGGISSARSAEGSSGILGFPLLQGKVGRLLRLAILACVLCMVHGCHIARAK